MKFRWVLIILSSLLFTEILQVSAAPPKQAIALSISVDTILAEGFSNPVQITHAGDGSGRLFVVEQGGVIKIIHPNLTTSTFLDIHTRVLSGGERGLLGLAFHPNYAGNGYFYLNYTDTSGNTTIARFQVSSNPNIADFNSESILFKINQPYSNHNGGQLLFGPDGYLYIGMGDGGSGGDPQNYAQNLTSPLGKMLRIDVNSANPYAIPADNPFISTPGADPRIWTWGLRNPWRFSFDRLTGDIFIGDVGQNQWEEIDFQASTSIGGENFGWRCMEGTHIYSTAVPCNNSTYLASLVPPITEYSHSEGNSITGGFVYRGTQNPAFYGVYFFADFVEGKIFSLQKIGNSWTRTMELDTGLLISAFGEDEEGELYLVDYGGKIRKILDPSIPQVNLDQTRISVDQTQANPGETLTYTIEIINPGAAFPSGLTLINSIPSKIALISGTASTTSGVLDTDNPAQLSWNGTIGAQQTITISYQAAIKNNSSGSIVNLISLHSGGSTLLERHAVTTTPRPFINATIQDFFFPGTQPGLSVPLIDSVDCKTCHSIEIYDRWRGSTMSQSGRDPLSWAAIFNANATVTNAGEFCLRCHTPSGWYEGRSTPSDGTALLPQDIRNGISCQLCHRSVDIIPSPSDETINIDRAIREAVSPLPPSDHRASAMILLDPQDNRRGPFSLPGFGYHSAYRSDLLSQSQNAWKESSLCGNCHNIDNPLLSWDESRGQYWPNSNNQAAEDFSKGALFPIERTFDEWAASDFASAGVYDPQFAGTKPDGIVRSCQDCHMPRLSGLAALEQFNPQERDCVTTGCLPEHSFLGANSWLPTLLQNETWRLSAPEDALYLEYTRQKNELFLKKSASLQAQIIQQGPQKIARVTVTNNTGHKLPTGYPEGRRMWLHVQAFDEHRNLVYESGKYDWQSNDLILDPFIKVYETKQGLTSEWASQLGLESGESFQFALNNTIIKDNRIPPRGIIQSEYNQIGLIPVGTSYPDNQYWDTTDYVLPDNAVSLIVRLEYQVASKEYIEFLVNNGGYDGYLLQSLWNDTPSLPVLIQLKYFPEFTLHFPVVYR
jgi:uncharacterized repeat protein (TIGR01451 family)